MNVINYYDLDEIKDAAKDRGQDLTETSTSFSFRIFRGRTCTHLHILQIVNLKDKKPDVPIKTTSLRV